MSQLLTRLPVLHRAGNGTRTRDPNLGKVVLYQLSYSRVPPKSNPNPAACIRLADPEPSLAMEARGIEPLTS